MEEIKLDNSQIDLAEKCLDIYLDTTIRKKLIEGIQSENKNTKLLIQEINEDVLNTIKSRAKIVFKKLIERINL